MFIMMNAARLGVGLQGLAQGEVAYQNAAAYARDRRQSRALKESEREPDAKADPIIVHPDVRRMLMESRAWNEAGRALVLWGALAGRPRCAARPTRRSGRQADDLLGLLTPVIKGYLTDKGFAAAVHAQQVLGGHGYIREHGIEQFVRDARITQIYEGTNGIQAMDLVGRKLPQGRRPRGPRLLRAGRQGHRRGESGGRPGRRRRRARARACATFRPRPCGLRRTAWPIRTMPGQGLMPTWT